MRRNVFRDMSGSFIVSSTQEYSSRFGTEFEIMKFFLSIPAEILEAQVPVKSLGLRKGVETYAPHAACLLTYADGCINQRRTYAAIDHQFVGVASLVPGCAFEIVHVQAAASMRRSARPPLRWTAVDEHQSLNPFVASDGNHHCIAGRESEWLLGPRPCVALRGILLALSQGLPPVIARFRPLLIDAA